jgi:hypothetical protein
MLPNVTMRLYFFCQITTQRIQYMQCQLKLCDFIIAVHTTIEHSNNKPLSITTKQKLATHIVAFYNICKDTGATPLIHDDITQSEKVSSNDMNINTTLLL